LIEESTMRRCAFALALTCLLGQGAGAAPKPGQDAPAKRHVFDWVKILPAGDERRTARERSLTALWCLHEEVEHPSQGRRGPLATRHEEMLRGMLDFLGHERVRDGLDAATVTHAITTATGEERDCLLLLAGLLDEKPTLQWLTDYLVNSVHPPYLRAVAAQAIGTIRDPKSIPVLLRVAKSDPLWNAASKASVGTSTRSLFKVYPLRYAAINALRRYDLDRLLPDDIREAAFTLPYNEEFTDEEYAEVLKEIERERKARVDAKRAGVSEEDQ
jgi:hypothetical protein